MAAKKKLGVVEKVKKAVEKKEFELVVHLNDQVFKTKTNDLEEAIQSFAPEFLKTKLIIQVTKGKKTLERVLYLQRGKILFTNRYALGAFVRSLTF